MPLAATYAHTNIVARDWQTLARFYETVFGCESLPPERHYEGDWVRDVTGLTGELRIDGIHLRLPGHGPKGPTLEIFQYNEAAENLPPAANRLGFAHLAFHVPDVDAAREAVLEAGGKDLGKVHRMDVPGAGHITLVYLTDPEGNIVELQTWSDETDGAPLP